jgi:hypothetical protein
MGASDEKDKRDEKNEMDAKFEGDETAVGMKG